MPHFIKLIRSSCNFASAVIYLTKYNSEDIFKFEFIPLKEDTYMTSDMLEALKLQNRFAPLPLEMHAAFCAVATVLFLFLFLRKKRMSDLYWMLVCDTTLILQFYYDPATATAVGICEIVLLGLIVWEAVKEAKAKKAAKLAEKEAEKNSADEIEELDQLVRSERRAIMDENKVDVIGDAFDGEDVVK